jgi:hypothetical protein
MTRRGRATAGGVAVLIATAMAALAGVGGPRATLAGNIAGIVVVLLLLVGAWLLADFVKRHGDEIGEARFDTRNKDDRDG